MNVMIITIAGSILINCVTIEIIIGNNISSGFKGYGLCGRARAVVISATATAVSYCDKLFVAVISRVI